MHPAIRRLTAFLLAFIAPVLVGSALVGSASGETYVVDDDGGPGVDFTDIPAAVAFAKKGDVLLVAPGSYSAFNLKKGLTILGSGPSSVVASGARVQQVKPSQIAVLADLQVTDLAISVCDGTVIVDGVSTNQLGGSSTRVSVGGCIDVRFRDCTIVGTPTAMAVDTSRVEIADSTVLGADGADSQCGDASPGNLAVEVTASRVHFAAPNVAGGQGGNQFSTCISFCGGFAGDGGDGAIALGCEVFVTGRAGDRLAGGQSGLGSECACDAFTGGDGVRAQNTVLRYDDGVVVGGVGLACALDGEPVQDLGGNSLTVPAELEPTLTSDDTPMPGQSFALTITGEPGASARFYLGRFPDLGFSAANQIEHMTSEERMVSLGALPPNGELTLNLILPANVTSGFAFHAQVEVVNPGGFVQRSNSLPMVMR